MSKFCSKCGNKLDEGVKYCPKCGNDVNGETKASKEQNYSFYSGEVVNRNVVVAIILTFLTCGIYGLFWVCVMTDDANKVSGEETDTSGALAVLFTILTCGIYGFYWNYRMGQKLYKAGGNTGKNINDNSIVYLLLSIFGLSIVSYCLIQNDLNQFS